jgi:hypothetical protein
LVVYILDQNEIVFLKMAFEEEQRRDKMKRYSVKEFVKVVEESDIVYGTCSLNAAMNIESRIRKKSLLKQLESASVNVDELGIFASFSTDTKGRKILKLV